MVRFATLRIGSRTVRKAFGCGIDALCILEDSAFDFEEFCNRVNDLVPFVEDGAGFDPEMAVAEGVCRELMVEVMAASASVG